MDHEEVIADRAFDPRVIGQTGSQSSQVHSK